MNKPILLLLLCAALCLCEPCPKVLRPPVLPTPLPKSLSSALTSWDNYIQGFSYPFPYGIGVTLSYQNTTLFSKNYGALYPHKDMYFRIGSVTKVFSAILAFQLAEEGKINLDVPLQTYFPELMFSTAALEGTNHRQPTTREILSQMGGLPREAPCKIPNGCDYTTEQMTALMRNNTYLIFPPGSTPSYSNLGFAIIGNFMAKKMGMSYEQAIQTKILNPLKMTGTGLKYTPSVISNLAGWNASMNFTLWENGWVAPAGSIYTTLADISTFQRALSNNCQGIFRYPETCNDMFEVSYITQDKGYFQGLPFFEQIVPGLPGKLVVKGGSEPIDAGNGFRAATEFTFTTQLGIAFSVFVVGRLGDLEYYGLSTSHVSSGLNLMFEALETYIAANPKPYNVPDKSIVNMVTGSYQVPPLNYCLDTDKNGTLRWGRVGDQVAVDFRTTLPNGNFLFRVPYEVLHASCMSNILGAYDNAVLEFVVDQNKVTGLILRGVGLENTLFKKISPKCT